MADADGKYRWFMFLVYPSSAPADWWEWCKESHGEYCRSPLHSADGEVSEPHYHVIYRHPNTVRLSYARKRLGSVAANSYVEPVVHPSNAMRYLVHMDDKDKEQWCGDPYALCECLGGFPLDFTREYTPADRREQRKLVLKYIRDHSIVEYSLLVYQLLDEGLFDLFDYACSHTIFITHLLQSLRHGTVAVKESNADNDSYVKYVPVIDVVRGTEGEATDDE